ncbi:MAG TPA: type II toxin-antitoxin system RelE/ParE family toxin [Terricaulis sp.]|nr:type II toxin-antitoxin system RelE/ParE family toxin [Terricaulis sp.]HRP12149.1 type II toxin-antitoxin system RelE/ParE family toxin [Terricaulis sp.]
MIVYAPDADRDVTRLHDGLLGFSLRAASAFMFKLALAERRIGARPQTYRRLRDGQTRRYSFKLNRTTDLVDYQIEPAQIVVLRVWHGRQDRPE